jgi:hypothetical protein
MQPEGVEPGASLQFGFTTAPLGGEAAKQALFLPSMYWSKNEQLNANHVWHGAETGMNGLSTDCSTVFVCKRKGRA